MNIKEQLISDLKKRHEIESQRIKSETQYSTVCWALETFGIDALTKVEGTYLKLVEEMEEFKEAYESGDKAKICDEAADLMVLLVQVVHHFNENLYKQFEAKMHVNRNRKWDKTAVGNYQHVD